MLSIGDRIFAGVFYTCFLFVFIVLGFAAELYREYQFWLIFGSVFFFSVSLLYFGSAGSRLKELPPMLDDDCDPVRYIQVVDALMRRPIVGRHFNSALVIHLSIGYIENGEGDKAIDLLENALKNGLKRRNYRGAAHSILCIVYLKKKDTESAMAHYEKIKNARSTRYTRKLVKDLDFVLTLEQVPPKEVIDHKQKVLSESANRLERAHAHYLIAKAYKELGDSEKEKEHLEYVAENGNLLHIARLAREKLGLPQPPEIVQDSKTLSCEK